jgi:hypothetical protein
MIETYEEIRAREREAEEAKNTARRLYYTERELKSARSTLEAARRSLSEPDPSVAALEQIIALSQDVSDSFTTKGNQLTPGGQSVAFVIRSAAGDALAKANAQREAIRTRLPEYEKREREAQKAYDKLTAIVDAVA